MLGMSTICVFSNIGQPNCLAYGCKKKKKAMTRKESSNTLFKCFLWKHFISTVLQPIQVAQVVQLLQDGTSIQEGLMCLPAQSQEHGGDTRKRAIT